MNSHEPMIAPVRGTRDWLPDEFARLDGLQALLLDRFARAGYQRLRTSILEPTDLHERKSGAGIVGRLFAVAEGDPDRPCLRPELTAGIVRAYAEAEPPPALPWRVSHAGPVFRRERSPSATTLREFHQVGVERIGDGGPHADAEVIGLAAWSAREAGLEDVRIRLGHVGLILEVLDASGLPPSARSTLVELLSDAAADGRTIEALEGGLDRLARRPAADDPPSDEGSEGVGRLFQTLVPVVVGRRSGAEIVERVRRQWEMGRSLAAVMDRLRDRVRSLAMLRGPASAVLARLSAGEAGVGPAAVGEVRALVEALGHHGVPADRIELDLGFGRGIGFYTQMVFELTADTAAGPVEVCGGGRYDGLARVLGSDRDDRGVGFAFGLERVGRALGAAQSPKTRALTRVVPMTPEALLAATRVADALRRAGGSAVMAQDLDGPGIRVDEAGGLTLPDGRRTTLEELIEAIPQ